MEAMIDVRAEKLTVTEIKDMRPDEFAAFLAEQAELDADYRDEQRQAWRPL